MAIPTKMLQNTEKNAKVIEKLERSTRKGIATKFACTLLTIFATAVNLTMHTTNNAKT